MTMSIDSALSLHADALRLREQRTEVLAGNLANADTPGFKARDLDFAGLLARQAAGQSPGAALAATDPRHIGRSALDSPGYGELLYRVPTQSSLDGNTVDPHLEKAAFAENAVRYQATLMILGSRINGLRTAIRGE
jgi:flagellar basal-body rod protein FlgB